MNMELLLKVVKETDSIFFDANLRADVKKKGDSDFVTRADCEISEYLHRRLSEEFPDVDFLSEEGNTSMEEGRDYWILDPIDGTTNFMHGLSFCAISLGLYSGGDVIAGVIYLPYTNQLFWAQKGKGAYLNGERIFCSSHTRLSDCIGLMEMNAYFKNDVEAAMEHARRIYLSCQDFRTVGSAAVELAYIASGRADVFFGRYLKPWDYAAGLCIVREAGGVVSGLDGALDLSKWNEHVLAAGASVFDDFRELMK